MEPLNKDTKIYVMVHPVNGARISCNEKYLPHWIARGFVVEEIKISEQN